MPHINDKVADWSARFGHILRASAETQFSHLYKGAVGGIEHVVSVDNGGYYMELWRGGENKDNYYATTGAAIKPLPGLAKGARLDEALDRFFTLMSTVEKERRIDPTRSATEGNRSYEYERKKPPVKKAIPKKAKRLLHLRGEQKAIPKKVKRLLNLDKGEAGVPDTAASRPESVGLYRPKGTPPGTKKYPRTLVPRKAGQRAVHKKIIERVDPEIGPSQSVGHRKPSNLSPESGVSKLARRMIRNLVGEPTAQMRKNVVALTAPGGVANQPGSGRVKPGTPPQTYRSPQGFSGRRMGGPGSKSPAAGTSGAGIKQAQNLGQKTTQRRAPYVGSRPAGASSPLLRRRKIDDITGGRVGEGGKITPVKPATGGPGQPTGYGSTGMPQYSYGRKAAKGCGCSPAAEVRKAVRMIAKHKDKRGSTAHHGTVEGGPNVEESKKIVQDLTGKKAVHPGKRWAESQGLQRIRGR